MKLINLIKHIGSAHVATEKGTLWSNGVDSMGGTFTRSREGDSNEPPQLNNNFSSRDTLKQEDK